MSPRRRKAAPTVAVATSTIPVRATRSWSPQQSAIFDWCEGGQGNAVIVARAGTGKTTTIVAGSSLAPESRILLGAFNKRIAEELTTKIQKPNITAKTFHSVGFYFVRQNMPRVNVDSNRGFRLAKAAASNLRDIHPDMLSASVGHAISKLAGLGKNIAPAGRREDLVALCLQYDVEVEGAQAAEWSTEDLAEAAQSAMALAKQPDGTIDYDDMLWLPIEHKWFRPIFDLVFIDEAQDMNPAQLIMATGICAGRIAVVGDPAQAIYGFRGADSNAISRMKDELRAVELPLNVTYRCPKAVVALANTLVEDFTAAPEAPDGVVTDATEDDMVSKAQPGDFVLSRLNAPLGHVCLSILRTGRPAKIVGRDIAAGLSRCIKARKRDLIPDLLEELERWRLIELKRLSAMTSRGVESKVEHLNDQVETIEALSEGLETTAELLARIDAIFADGTVPAVMCSSVHKAKGLEAERVWVMADTLYMRGRRPDDPEEKNIAYVAYTRAKRELVLVRTPRPAPEGAARKEG